MVMDCEKKEASRMTSARLPEQNGGPPAQLERAGEAWALKGSQDRCSRDAICIEWRN